MHIDLYTKTILTFIALLLAVIALKPIIQPTPALAQANMSGVQFSAIRANSQVTEFTFFDPKNGNIWTYNPVNGQIAHFRLTQLGQPLGQ